MAGQQTPATALLIRQKVAHRLHPYQHQAGTHAYGEEAAAALDIAPTRCFKTLVANVDGGLVVAVVPVSGSLDLKALATATGGKRAVMADPVVAERTTGYVVGGISPIAQRKRLPTVVDESATGQETVYVSAGRRGLQVEIAPADLVRVTGATVAAIAGE